MKHLIIIVGIGLLFLTSCQTATNQKSEKKTIPEKENPVVTALNTADSGVAITIQPELENSQAQPLDIIVSEKSKSGNKELTAEEKDRDLALRRAKTSFKNGKQYYEEGNYQKAIESYKVVLEQDETNDQAYFNLGKIYAMQGQQDLALSYYEDAIKYNPSDSASLVGIGMIYYNLGEFAKAIEFYTRSIEAGPNYGLAYYNRGTVLGQSKNYDAALADLTKAISLEPNNHQAYMNRGLAYYYTKQLDKACMDWNKAAELGSTEGVKAVEIYCTPKTKDK